MKNSLKHKQTAHADSPSPVTRTDATVLPDRQGNLSSLLVRTSLSLLLLFHGVLADDNAQFVTRALSDADIPAPLAKFFYIGELTTLLMVLFGIWTRPAAAAIAINLGAAILLAHFDDIHLFWIQGDWALELQLLYLILALSVVLRGAGRYSIGGANGRWN